MSDQPPPTPTGGTPRRRPPPNYAARRMLVSTVAIVAIVAFGVVGWMVIRDDPDGFTGSGRTWNEVAIVDPTSGEVTVHDDEGGVERTIIGRGRVNAVHAIGDRIALVGPTQIVLEGDDDDETVTVPIGRADTVTPVRTSGGLDLIVGTPTGGNVRIVDVSSGELVDIGALARAAEPQTFAEPLLFAETVRWSADGRRYAVADAGSFQTIVVEKGSADVKFFRAQPVALDDDRVVTSQTIGGQAEVELYDDDRNSKARVPTPIPAGAIMHDGDLLMVTVDGGIHRVSDGDIEATRLAGLAVPSGDTVASMRPTADGERLVVTGAAFEAIVDLEGTTLFTTTFTNPIAPDVPERDWDCVPIGGGASFHSIVAAVDGEQLADLTGVSVTGTSGDGCTVIGERAGITEVVGPNGTVVLGRLRAATLGPDGRTVVRTTSAGATELLRINDDLGIDDSVVFVDAPANALVAFLD